MAKKKDPNADAPSTDNSKVEDAAAERMKVETEQGFRGVEVDPTPNENYTLAGQNKGKPTPETDDKAAEAARKASLEAEDAAKGVG